MLRNCHKIVSRRFSGGPPAVTEGPELPPGVTAAPGEPGGPGGPGMIAVN